MMESWKTISELKETVRKKAIEDCVEAISNLVYNSEGIGCGLEDRCITDRYTAAEYGFYEGIEMALEALLVNVETSANLFDGEDG